MPDFSNQFIGHTVIDDLEESPFPAGPGDPGYRRLDVRVRIAFDQGRDIDDRHAVCQRHGLRCRVQIEVFRFLADVRRSSSTGVSRTVLTSARPLQALRAAFCARQIDDLSHLMNHGRPGAGKRRRDILEEHPCDIRY